MSNYQQVHPQSFLSFSKRLDPYRWKICALLFFATTINYIDRQVLAILAPQLQKEFGWRDTEYGMIVSSFQIAYAIGFLFMGRLMDKIGSRLGYILSIGFWSIAMMLHALFRTAAGFSFIRFMLGIGESGNFPAAIKVVTEWFPKKERSLATGIFVSGSSIGAILAPLVIPLIALHFGWRWAFLSTGILGFFWLICWIRIYRPLHPSNQHPSGELPVRADSGPDLQPKLPWSRLLRYRQTWAFALGKLLTDPVFSFYFFFLPKFFYKNFGLGLDKIAPPLMIIYIMSDIGSIAGGWFSFFLIKRGWSINAGRKTTMLISALAVTPVYFASQTSHLWVAVGIIGFALAAHQAWSANIFTLVSDMFPEQTVGSVVGIGSMLGAIGGMFGAGIAGFLLEANKGYGPLFLVAGSTYLIALGIIQSLAPRLEFVEIKK
jgi:MFS transporter, ACS family, hexuronate transporter